MTRVYDGAVKGKGLLWKSYAGGTESNGSTVERTVFDSYDAMGRPLVLNQSFKVNNNWKPAYQTTRVYNLAGAVTSQTYPSQHFAIYNYDDAGRLADKNANNLAFTGNLGDGATRIYSRGILYASGGQLSQEQFGTATSVYNKLFYNSRQRLAEILVSTTTGNTWDRGKILNQYSLQCSGATCDATDNNYFMIQVGAGNMLFRSRVNGVNDQTVFAFDGAANRFWRIRHEQAANLIHFETSTTGSVWLTRKTVTPGFSLTSLRLHLVAGAYGTGNSSPGTVKYDNLKLLSSSTGSFSLTVPNAGFETPVIGNGNFQYAPSGASWSFANGGGITGMNSGFTGVPSAAPQGVQVAFLQATGEASQSISGFQAGSDYVITFNAIQRTNCCNTGGQDIGVYIDSTQIGSVHPGTSGYTEYSIPFTTSAGAHTIKFVGLNPLG